jgi:uncharacterized protein (TIGR02646 family)
VRYIIQDDVEENLPGDWHRLVAEAEEFVQGKVSEARTMSLTAGKSQGEAAAAELKALHTAINQRSGVWKKAADALREASSNKCWYCELAQNRSDMPVDHFRPKNRVQGAPDHPGYWWLAFDWRNLRYSCTFCNSRRRDVEMKRSGGKHDNFPIIEPPPRATSRGAPQDRPALLDPVVDGDTKLLTFHTNGFPIPVVEDNNAEEYKRADESIRLYHLDHAVLVRKRKTLAIDIRQFFDLAERARTEGNEDVFRKNKKEIIKRLRSKAELSIAARVYLGSYRTEPWVQEIFDRDL